MKLSEALNAHTDWKIRLRWAISERTTVDVGDVGRADRCELGWWLAGKLTREFGHHPLFDACVRAHDAFHLEAAKVAAAINAGNYAQAQRMLEPGSAYAVASHDTVAAIDELKRQTLKSGFWNEVE